LRDLDPVVAAAAGRPGVVDVAALDQVIAGHARGVVASDVHTFAFSRPDRRSEQAGVVDVVAPDDERVGVAAVQADRVVPGLVDLVVLEGNVMAADEAHAAVTALEMQAPDDQVGGVDDLDVVLVAAEVGGLRPGDDRALAVCRADRDGAGRRPVDGDEFSNSSLQEASALDGKISTVAARAGEAARWRTPARGRERATACCS
jgi:hypothetical protein